MRYILQRVISLKMKKDQRIEMQMKSWLFLCRKIFKNAGALFPEFFRDEKCNCLHHHHHHQSFMDTVHYVQVVNKPSL